MKSRIKRNIRLPELCTSFFQELENNVRMWLRQHQIRHAAMKADLINTYFSSSFGVFKLDSLVLPRVWRWRRPQCSPKGPSFSSSAGAETCQRSAPFCETSSQSGKSIPSLPLVPFSIKRKIKACTHCIYCVHSSSILYYSHLSCCRFVRNLPSLSFQSHPAVVVVHLLCCNPGFGFIIRGDCHSIFPT